MLLIKSGTYNILIHLKIEIKSYIKNNLSLNKTYIWAPNNIELIVTITPPTHINIKIWIKVWDISFVSFDWDKKKLSNKV